MLRSFDYAARYPLGDLTPDPQAVYRAAEWAGRNREAFCDGYAHAAGRDPREQDVLLRAYEADKVVYEVVYESRMRPAWVSDPDVRDRTTGRLMAGKDVPPTDRRPRSLPEPTAPVHDRTWIESIASGADHNPARPARSAPRARRCGHPGAPSAGHLGHGGHRQRPVPAGARARRRVRGPAPARRGPGLPARGRPRAGPDGDRRPVSLPADPRRGGPPPHRRGPARAALAGPRCPRAPLSRAAGRRHRNGVRGLGPERPRRSGRRRLQPLGRSRPPDALARVLRRLGALRPRRRRRHPLQVRGARLRRRTPAEVGPDGAGHRASPGHGVAGLLLQLRVERQRLDAAARRRATRTTAR